MSRPASSRHSQSHNGEEDDDEWNANDVSLNDDLEHIYAKEIKKYNSNASSESEEESSSGDEFYEAYPRMEGRSEDEYVEDSSDDLEMWASEREAKKAKKRRKLYDGDDERKRNRIRPQKKRCTLRFQTMKPLPMPDLEEKQEILDKIKTADFKCVGYYEEMEAWSEAEVYLCKFIQCTLWDCNFRFTLLPHQFVAVVAVAGINLMNLLHLISDLKDDYETLVNLGSKGMKFRKCLCTLNITFVETSGILLADEMGLGKTVSVSSYYIFGIIGFHSFLIIRSSISTEHCWRLNEELHF